MPEVTRVSRPEGYYIDQASSSGFVATIDTNQQQECLQLQLRRRRAITSFALAYAVIGAIASLFVRCDQPLTGCLL